MNFDIISSRTISAFPLSVGTALAFESIFTGQLPTIDPERKIPQKVNLLDYDEFYCNISTLFRNLIGSLAKDDSKRVTPRELTQGLIEEIETIENLVKTETLNRTKIIFYVCEYKSLNKLTTKALFRQDSTQNQLLYRDFHNKSIAAVLKHFGPQSGIRIYDSKIKPLTRTKALILTHSCYDLLSHKEFKELHLIESHTGIIKRFPQWNTKYTDGKNLSMMPFNGILLRVFGDSELFRPHDNKLRKEIIELAKEKRWTPVTTEQKILYDIQYLKNPFFIDIVKSFK